MAKRGAVTLAPALVLHRRPYRDSSLLLECYAREHGRIGLVARGARAPRARLAGLLQPFQPLLLSWAGGGELATLHGAEADGTALVARGAALAAGFYASELVLRACTRHDPHPVLYDAYRALLERLAGSGLDEAALRGFEATLLKEIGYGLTLTHTADGAPLTAADRYVYLTGRGPVPAQQHEGISGATLLALDAGTLGEADEAMLREARRLLRAELTAHLGDRPWQSRRLYTALAGAGAPEA